MRQLIVGLALIVLFAVFGMTPMFFQQESEATPSVIQFVSVETDCYERNGLWMVYCTSWTTEYTSYEYPDPHYYRLASDPSWRKKRHVNHSQSVEYDTRSNYRIYDSCSWCGG